MIMLPDHSKQIDKSGSEIQATIDSTIYDHQLLDSLDKHVTNLFKCEDFDVILQGSKDCI